MTANWLEQFMERFIAFLLALLAFLFASCSSDYPVAPTPAAKVTEASGFDFRLKYSEEIKAELPLEYRRLIRKAAVRWEAVVYSGAWVRFVRMPSEPFALGFLGSEHELFVENPQTYLGDADIEVFVYINYDLQDEEGLWAQQSWYWEDASLEEQILPVMAVAIAPFVVERAKEGTLSKEYFYGLMLHELGHALGLGGFFNLKEVWAHRRNPLVEIRNGDCEYVGLLGVIRWRIMTRQRQYGQNNSIPMDSGCVHWDIEDSRWHGFVDVMFPYGSVNDWGRISPVSIGALQDMGYLVDHSEADEVLLSPAKPTVEGAIRGHGAGPLIRSIELLD